MMVPIASAWDGVCSRPMLPSGSTVPTIIGDTDHASDSLGRSAGGRPAATARVNAARIASRPRTMTVW